MEEIFRVENFEQELEKNKSNITQKFIEKLKLLGGDFHNVVIKKKDTIKTLGERLGISEKEIIRLGLNPEDKIGQTKSIIAQAHRGKGNSIPPTEEQLEILLEMGISLEKSERNVTQEFIEKLKLLGGDFHNVDIKGKDTIKTLGERLGISEEEIIKLGLNPEDKIGQTKAYIIQAYRGNRTSIPPTEEQLEILLEMGISLEKNQRKDIVKDENKFRKKKVDITENITQKFIEKLKQLGGDFHNVDIKVKDTIKTLGERLGISEEEIIKLGLNPEDKIGQTKAFITQTYRGNRTSIPPTEEQLEILLEMGISIEKNKSNITQKFIEKLKLLGGDFHNVDIKDKDTIKTLGERLGISEEEIIKLGLNPEDKIGQTKSIIARAHRGKGTSIPPTKEQLEILLEMGISLELERKREKKGNVTQNFIEKLKQLGGDFHNVDIKDKDTIKTLGERLGINEEEIIKLGLNPKDKIGKTKDSLRQAHRGKGTSIPPTKEQLEILLEMGISFEKKIKVSAQEIGQASFDANTVNCLEADKICKELMKEKNRENGERNDDN